MLKALEVIEKTSINIVNFLVAFSGTKSESLRALRNFSPADSAPLTEELRELIKERRKAQYYVGFLKREGFICLKDGKIGLTSKGHFKLRILKKRPANELPVGNYKVAPNKNIVLVVFDIPEKRRKIRDWLRVVLKRMNFNMIQKSVWLGKVQMPEEFINDLKALKLLENVEILAVTKSGSLNKLA